MRAKRTHLLYHGTLLYNFDLSLIDTCLRMPPRQPNYRESRPHLDFVTNLPVDRPALLAAIDRAWPTSENLDDWPRDRVAALVNERFSHDRWNLEFELSWQNCAASYDRHVAGRTELYFPSALRRLFLRRSVWRRRSCLFAGAAAAFALDVARRSPPRRSVSSSRFSMSCSSSGGTGNRLAIVLFLV